MRSGPLFLKYLDGLKQDRADETALGRKKYAYIFDKPCRWETWAAPKGKDGKLDHNKALTGDDLRDFVNQKLFPYLQKFKEKASGANTIEYKVAEIYGEIKNKIPAATTWLILANSSFLSTLSFTGSTDQDSNPREVSNRVTSKCDPIRQFVY